MLRRGLLQMDEDDDYNDYEAMEGSGDGSTNQTLLMLQNYLYSCLSRDGSSTTGGLGGASIFFITLLVFLGVTFLSYLNWNYLLKYKEQQGVDVAEEAGAPQPRPWSNIARD